MLVSNLVIQKILGVAPANNEETVQRLLRENTLYLIFSSCLFAPFCEELIFRKALKNVFKSDTFFVICSGLIFGGIHIISNGDINQFLYIVPYGIFGVIFGYMYVKSKSIFTSMTFHFIHNTILVIISLYVSGVI